MGRWKKGGPARVPTWDGPITRSNMLEPMLVVLPHFRPQWEDLLADWEEEDPPIYTGLSDLARMLGAMLQAGDANGLRAAFAIVELWHAKGDHFVREAATVGLIEDLQNKNLVKDPAGMLPFLGSRSRQAWDDVEAFWRDGTRIPDRSAPSARPRVRR